MKTVTGVQLNQCVSVDSLCKDHIVDLLQLLCTFLYVCSLNAMVADHALNS